MDDSTVSVITPSYNQAEFIRDNLESVRNQTGVDVEHIVIDGRSNDGTREILEEYDSKYDLKWVSEPDEGQSDAVNKGFELASGDIIGWLNSDDVYLTPDVLSSVRDRFASSDPPDIIYGDIAELDEQSIVRRLSSRPEFESSRLIKGCYIPQPSTFMHAEVVADERLRSDLNYCMDYEFWLRLRDKYDIRHADAFYSGFRRYPGQKSQTAQARKEEIEMLREYGILEGHQRGLLRTGLSSLRWRLNSVPKTIRFRRSNPELAFEGDLEPLRNLIWNALLPDSLLWK